MKLLFLVFICIFLSISGSFAQTADSSSVASPPAVVEIQLPPEFPGGIPALQNYLALHLRYPEDARRNGVEGIVLVGFIVSEDGSVKDVQIRKSLSVSCDAAARWVVKRMPKWKPSMLGGKPMAVPYMLPIHFVL